MFRPCMKKRATTTMRITMCWRRGSVGCPRYPTFNQNGIDLIQGSGRAGHESAADIGKYVAEKLKNRKLKFAIEDPDHPDNFPRNLFVWRANLISSSGKGHEYFLKHLLGTSHGLMNDDKESLRPEEMTWRDKAPEGKLDLLINLEFRMAGTALYSDIVLPAATWYEKHDLSSTDMHPFIHPFNPAISPQWEARSDWEIFKSLPRGSRTWLRKSDWNRSKKWWPPAHA